MIFKRIILLGLFLMNQLCFSQAFINTSGWYWQEIIETNFETTNKDTLTLILSEWANSSTRISQDSLIGQKDFIVESYGLFPELKDALYREFCDRLQLKFESAVVEVNSNFENCYPTFYFIFEKNGENWVFKRFFSLNQFQNCMDFNENFDIRKKYARHPTANKRQLSHICQT